MPKGGPDLAIVLAEKAGKAKGEGGDDSEGMFRAMAEDMVDAVKGGDSQLIAEILRALVSEAKR